MLNGHQFLNKAFALRRMAFFPTPIVQNASGAPINGAVFASLRVDTTQAFANGAKLLRIAEMAQGRQRQLDMGTVWIGESSDDKVFESNISFIEFL